MNSTYYSRHKEKILARQKRYYQERSEEQIKKSKEYQRNYYKSLRAYNPNNEKVVKITNAEVKKEKPKPVPIPAVKDNRCDVVLEFK